MPDFGSRWINPTLLKPGGQAITYLVEDAQTDGKPTCVAKILNNTRPERRPRFLQEIRSTEEFDHPNVVKSIAQGETKKHKQPFFVMPYYVKGTLEENHGRLGSPLDRLRLFLQICEGVAYAHAKGLIHGDLKPANIFLSQETIPIVGDFGLCYRHDLEADDRVTQSDQAVVLANTCLRNGERARSIIPNPVVTYIRLARFCTGSLLARSTMATRTTTSPKSVA
jgi:serine/threonine protein kinase